MKHLKYFFSFLLLGFLPLFGGMLFGETLINNSRQLNPALAELANLLEIRWDFTIPSVNAYMQQNFLRRPTEERYSVSAGKFEALWSDALPIFDKLNLVSAIAPERKHYAYLIFNGQSIPMMRNQIKYILEQEKNGLTFDSIYFLCGDRPLIREIDGEDPLFSSVQTESEAAQKLMMEYFSDSLHTWKIIAAPMNADGHRPNTRDTVQTWLAVEAIVPGSILMVSNNPFISYQYETLYNALLAIEWFQRGGSLDACGDTVIWNYANRFENRMAIMLDNLARLFYTENERLMILDHQSKK